jgi:hypothetical protein
MGVSRVLLLMLLLATALLSSCATAYHLYSEGDPESPFFDDLVVESEGSKVRFGAQKFDTVTPTLRWAPFTKFASIFDRTPVEVENLRYHLVVYKVSSLADYRFTRYLRPDPGKRGRYLFMPEPGLWFIEETALTENSYTFPRPLETNITYVWSVSANYEYAGEKVQDLNWLRLNDLKSNQFLFSFTTPEMP